MRTLLSYLLLVTLALSGLSGSVQPVMAATLADNLAAQHQHATTDNADLPCHQAQLPDSTMTEPHCCEQEQHQCQGDCCAKHCATATALLASELFRYIRPQNTIASHTVALPQWLFANEHRPPIIA